MRRVLVAVIALAGCHRSTVADPPVSVTPAANVPAPPAPKADPIVDLLHTVDCTVAVSSKVENPHDFPEHLVDGKQETAWNGKTGDLAGWIAVRVPRSARVTRIELTSGFDRTGPKGDLFTQNHRITKVRLSREGTVVKEVDLDPNVRTPQAIDLDEAGGDFKLDVLATVPGTEKKWRELTVSELRVWGRAGGAPENPSHLPRMAIGSLDGVRPSPAPSRSAPVTSGPYPDMAAMCKAYDRAMSPLIDRAFPGDRYPGKIEAPHCHPVTSGTAMRKVEMLAQGPFKSASLVIVHDTEQERERVVLETASGFARTDVEVWSRYLDDPGCMHGSVHELEDAKLVKTSTGQDVLVIRILDLEASWIPMESDYRGRFWTERAHACRLDDKGTATCEGPVTLGSAHEEFIGDPHDDANYVMDASKVPWTSRKEAVIGPAGDLRAVEPAR